MKHTVCSSIRGETRLRVPFRPCVNMRICQKVPASALQGPRLLIMLH